MNHHDPAAPGLAGNITAGLDDVRLFRAVPPVDAAAAAADFNEQFRSGLDRLRHSLQEAGGSLSGVLRAEIRITQGGAEAYGALQAAFLDGFATEPRPARCVSAADTLAGGALVEIGAIAAIGAAAPPNGNSAITATDGPAPCAPFPHARRHGDALWVTAQVGSDPLSASLVPVAGGSAAQLRQAISNLQKILAAARMTPAEVVHARVQYVDQHDRAALAAIIAEQDMPQGVATLSQVPFIPTAQTGVTVKVDAVARAAAD